MELNFWKWVTLLMIHLTWVNGEDKNRSETEKEILQKIFMVSKFHMYIKPDQSFNQTTDEPLQVFVSLYIINTNIDIKNHECYIHMYFRQEWNDSRLAFDNQGKINYLSIHDAVGFWTPDLFFVNEISGHHHSLTKPNSFVRIYPPGKVLYSQRLTVKLNCEMDLRKYPFDTQICKLPIESYGYSADDINLKWKPDTTFGKFAFLGYKISYSMIEEIIHVGENSYSRIELWVHFTRLIHTLLLHVYIPLGFLVVMSWFSLWLKPSAPLPRLTASIIPTFTTLLFLLSVRDFFQFSPYPTALDVWVGFCCLLIFGSTFENIYVLTFLVSDTKADGISYQKDVQELQKEEDKRQGKISIILNGNLPTTRLNIDAISRLMFPSIFTLFNVVYLAYYLI